MSDINTQHEEFVPETDANNVDIYGDGAKALKSQRPLQIIGKKDLDNNACGYILPSHDYRINGLDGAFGTATRPYAD